MNRISAIGKARPRNFYICTTTQLTASVVLYRQPKSAAQIPLAVEEDLRGSFVIFDDAIMSLTNSQAFLNLILNSVHHKHFSAALLSQSIFGMGRYSRLISNNCQYVFVWDSCRARLSVQNLARQMYPGEVNFFMAAFRHATASNAFSPLLIDCSPHVPPALRLRSNFFDLHQIAYLRSSA